MSFNVQTRTEFAAGSPEELIAAIGKENFLEMNATRTEWFEAAVADNKTDNIVTEDGIRNWNSQQSAQEFKTFLEALATSFGLEATVTIL
jgi:hypothetical protein